MVTSPVMTVDMKQPGPCAEQVDKDRGKENMNLTGSPRTQSQKDGRFDYVGC